MTGPPPPLCSVVIRTLGTPELDEALSSVAEQRYSNLEVVVVDAAGNGGPSLPEHCGPFPLRIVSSGAPLPRGAAANAGLDAARGDYLIFLDEDDWFEPEHIQGLVKALLSNPSARAAYAGVVHTPARGSGEGNLLNDPFDPVRLRRQNYIPIHAVLFARSLLDQGCRVDESLEVYEDWDLWLQISRLTSITHIHRITAGYRTGGNSGAGWGTDPTTVQQYQERLMAKWQHIWTPLELREALQWQDRRAELHNGELLAQTAARCAILEARLRTCDAALEAIARSTSWRMSAPLRAARRLWQRLFSGI